MIGPDRSHPRFQCARDIDVESIANEQRLLATDSCLLERPLENAQVGFAVTRFAG
jgi:hypothetical protein